MRNGEANSCKGLLRALRVLRGASYWNAKPRMNVEWGRMWNAEGGTRNAERDERGMRNGEAGTEKRSHAKNVKVIKAKFG